MKIERQVTINAPADKVFPYVADISKHPEWAAHKLEIVDAPSGPPRVGSTYTTVGHQMGTHKAKVTITEYSPSTKMVFESDDNTGLFRHYFLLEEKDGQTVLKKGTESIRMRFPFSILAPVVGRFEAPKLQQGDCDRIKAKIEGA